MIVQERQQQAAADKQGEVEQQLVAAYVEGICRQARCRQVVLDGYLDQREEERVRCKEGEEKCNVCSRAAGKEVAEEVEEDKDISDSEENSKENSKVGSSSGECATQTKQEERQQEFKQQQQAQRRPQQTLIGQQQQEFAEVE